MQTADGHFRDRVTARSKVWDLETGAELWTLSGHTNMVTAVAIYANDTRAISTSWDYTLRVWDLETGTAMRTLTGHTFWVTAVAVYGEGERAVSASYDTTLKVWDLKTGAEVCTLSALGETVSLSRFMRVEGGGFRLI